MTDHENFPTHVQARSGDPRGREAAQFAIHRAVRMLQAQHEVTESAAFLLLVRASADSRCSVRVTSSRMVAGRPGSA